MIGRLILPDKSGHSVVEFDTEVAESLAEAKLRFEGVIDAGGAAFNTETKERVTTWDPTAAEVIVLQPLVGG